MIAEAELQEYLDQIRQDVCSRCVERPAGGPPCVPLGKPCGVELHLAPLVEAVSQVSSPLIAPYLEHNREVVCEACPYLHSEHCPCPMDSLAVLVVQAIETVQERRKQSAERLGSLTVRELPMLDEIVRAHEVATGSWKGCDWPAIFGPSGLAIGGWTAEQAREYTRRVRPEDRQDWEEATRWLEQVEKRAVEAEREAALAVEAARSGAWPEAAEHAHRAWALEFTTGRPFRRQPATWQRLYELLREASHSHAELEVIEEQG